MRNSFAKICFNKRLIERRKGKWAVQLRRTTREYKLRVRRKAVRMDRASKRPLWAQRHTLGTCTDYRIVSESGGCAVRGPWHTGDSEKKAWREIGRASCRERV